MEKIVSIKYFLFASFLSIFSIDVLAHDTTHIHPLLTAKIRQLIQDTDASDAYLDIYELDPNPIDDGPPPQEQFLYWGTDFDKFGESQTYYLSEDTATQYTRYNNVIDGVVQEDIPVGKVLTHFYQADTGIELTVDNDSVPFAVPSLQQAMLYFNQSIEFMGGYTDKSKQVAFFTFGQALHHVEDMMSPAHIHNAAENALFASMLYCGPLKNTHVLKYTLRFFKAPRLALKQTASFSGANT